MTNQKAAPHSPLQRFEPALFSKLTQAFWIKRDDLIHPVISGNKWRKLKYNISHAQSQNKDRLISFGGAFSNHIHALAYAGLQAKIPTLAYIRGDQLDRANPTLNDCLRWGMQLKTLSRQDYRKKSDPAFLEVIQAQYPSACIIPEGGSNPLALAGVNEVWQELDEAFDYLIVPVGSAGTLAGLALNIPKKTKVIGVACLKGDFLEKACRELLAQAGDDANLRDRWTILSDYHFGGYAKFSSELVQFIERIYHQTGIRFDPIYTGKMLFATYQLAMNDYFEPGAKICLLHTGGIQGIRGLKYRSLLDENWLEL